jgi:hypothetical protein
VPIATRHPSSTAPTTCSTGVRASVKNVSLNSLSPVSCTIGRISMPGWSIGTSRYEMPLCLGAALSPARPAARFVRASTKHQSAHSASDVHTFCPSITHSEPSSDSCALVDRLARSDPAPGSL